MKQNGTLIAVVVLLIWLQQGISAPTLCKQGKQNKLLIKNIAIGPWLHQVRAYNQAKCGHSAFCQLQWWWPSQCACGKRDKDTNGTAMTNATWIRSRSNMVFVLVVLLMKTARMIMTSWTALGNALDTCPRLWLLIVAVACPILTVTKTNAGLQQWLSTWHC